MEAGRFNSSRKGAIVLACLLMSFPAVAQDIQAAPAPPPAGDDPAVDSSAGEPAGIPSPEDSEQATEEALRRVQEPFKEQPEKQAGEESIEEDLCKADYTEPHWQEDTREFFRDITCHSFRWFDGLFGNDIDYPEESVSGLATVGGSWNQYEGFDSRLRFRVRAPLPNVNRRWNLIIDRGDDNAYISDTETQDRTFYNPGLINRNDDDSLLLGLGGRPRDEVGRKGWDWSAGVKLRSSPVPYIRARWYYFKDFSDAIDLRFRQTFFWRSDDGLGTTSRADMTYALNPQDVLRLEGVVTYAEESPGAEWYFGHTWYHLMRDRKAFSLLAFATGETEGPVAMRDAGFNFIWRQNLTRDWIWLSYGPSITWPRFEPQDERELTLGFGVWVEMEFGNWSY